MSIDEIIAYVSALDEVLTLQPRAGDGSPEIAWGDVFFYYAPNGNVPKTQPFATIVTKDYPDDEGSRLDRPGHFRLNIGVGATVFRELTGLDPHDATPPDIDPSMPDAIFGHPVYGHLGWVAVVNPAEQTAATVLGLLAAAHEAARARHQRRGETPKQ